ncbi:GNAT family N-acetyltransferase [Streptomyces sp. BI20]|uniref:GNAT family N-acetyltransferase n=1 Tax=Streptomyces sp. BI20 TaxID=3403460 RepID=UPI003C7944F9
MTEITALSATTLRLRHEELGVLLLDVVREGASLGFLGDLDLPQAAAWWECRIPETADGTLALWIAQDASGRAVGTAGLRRATKPNGRHRAEVCTVMVHPEARRTGVARALLAAVESGAREDGVTLLHLDTETDSGAEPLYAAAGYTEVGTIPDYATDPEGRLRPTTLFYKRLDPDPVS